MQTDRTGCEYKSLLCNSCPRSGHISPCLSFPHRAKHHSGTNATSSTLLLPFLLQPGDKSIVPQESTTKRIFIFPSFSCPRPPPARIQLRVYVQLPGKQEARYHAEGDSRAISEICYPHALNKIKLKVLLCCQDKGQAGEIIFHSQTLNYSLRLYQIQSENK